MTRDPGRRTALAEAATDHVLEHGLLNLSLRPLAAALGTSDRMLLYHFTDKDDLVATVLRTANDRAVVLVRQLPVPGDVRLAVRALWEAFSSGPLERCQRLYVEAAALGLLGQEPQSSAVREGNRRWTEALATYLVDAGCAPGRAPRAVLLLDAAFMGFQLDLPLDRDSPELRRAVDDVADAVLSIASP